MTDRYIKPLLKMMAAIERGDATLAQRDQCRLLEANYCATIHAKLSSRWDLMDRISRCSHAGQVAINTGGRDCDMAQWDGDIRIIPANYWAFLDLLYALEESAEGPFWAYPIPWEDQSEIQYQSRDLALEAFEDGHQHVVYI